MKSTQKFLCYSLALVGAALIFTAGCKKDSPSTTTPDNSVAPTFNALTFTTASVSGTVTPTCSISSTGKKTDGTTDMVTEAGYVFAISGTTASAGEALTTSGTCTVGAVTGINIVTKGSVTTTVNGGALTASSTGTITIDPMAVGYLKWSASTNTLSPTAVYTFKAYVKTSGKGTTYSTPVTVTIGN